MHNIVKSDDELRLIAEEGIKLISLSTIIKQLNSEQFQVKSASGADFADLKYLAAQNV